MTDTTTNEVSFLDALRARYGTDDIDNYTASDFLVASNTAATAASGRPGKKWELVGMEKTRQQQSHYDRLVHVVLRDEKMTVAVKPSEVYSEDAGKPFKDQLAEANMKALTELDLSANEGLPLAEMAKLLPYFPRLDTLQLSDMPALLTLPPPSVLPPVTAKLTSARLTKLVLNNVGFTSIYTLQKYLLDAPALTELHLDSNHITGSFIFDSEEQKELFFGSGAKDTTVLQFPHVKTLSLAHNAIDNWSGLNETMLAIFPQVTELYLTDNKLPNIAVSPDANEFVFLKTLKLLCLNDNPHITDTATIDAIRELTANKGNENGEGSSYVDNSHIDSKSPYRHSLLRTFRISYEYIMPSWNETLKRMFVIASLPSITLLNRASIRRKERTDSELFYLQRGLAQQQQQQEKGEGETPQQPQQPSYPLLPLLLEQYKDVVLSVYEEGSTASTAGATHIMLTVTLVVANQFVATGGSGAAKGKPKAAANVPFQVQKTLPSSLTIAQLKALVKATFQIDLMHQKLTYVNKGDAQSGAAEQPVELTHESQSLGYYGVSDGAVVHITDTSLR